MKKKYVKPELFYEHYELSQHIADCAWEWVNNTSENDCYAIADPEKIPGGFDDFGPPTLFLEYPRCSVTPGGSIDYCYHSGAANANSFQS